MLVFLLPPHHLNLFFFSLPDAVVTGPGLQLQGVEAGMVPKREMLTVFNLHVTSPKGLTGQDVPSPQVAKSGLTVNVAARPGKGGLLAPHLRDPTPSEQKWTEQEALARLAPPSAIWTSTAPNLMSLLKVGTGRYKWREGNIVTKGKRMNEWVM